MFKTLSSFLLLALCSVSAFSADPPHPKLRAASSQEVYAAYWTLEPGWHTDIEVRNNIADTPVTVTPTLRFATGSEVVLAPVTISPQDVAMINLHEELAKVAPQLAGAVGSYGSVVLRYSSAFQKNIYAGSMVHYEGKPIAFHFDAWGEEDMMDEGTRESMWWLPNSTTDEHLVVSNVGAKASQLTVTIFDGAGKPYSQRLVLPPKQTRRYSVRDLVTANGITDTLGGLTVSVDKGSEAIFTANLSFDTSTGFSALMKTFEDSPKEEIHSVELRAPMLALSNPDPALTLPAGTELEPRIFMRNTTNAPLAIKGELHWRTADTKGLLPLAGLDLAANETRTIDLHAMQKAGKIPPDATWANLKLVYTGRYGDLVPIATSYDHDLSHGLQTPFTDIVSSHWVGSQWHADSLRHSLITAGNATDKQLTVQFTLHYNGGKGKYELEQTLLPGDQMFVDVAKIIRTQAPDKNGKTIPVDVTSGSYSFHDKVKTHGQTLYEGKLTIDQKYGFASYGCGGCCDPTAAELWPNPFGGLPGDTWGNNVIGFNPCDNMSYDLTTNAFSWLSGNTSVLTISAPTSTAIGAGSTFLQTSIMVPKQHILRCSYEQTNPGSTGSVIPTLSMDRSLWFFGTGNTPPGYFNLGGVTATLTATGAGTGSYVWTVTAGSSRLVFENGSSTITKSDTNTVGIKSIGYSTATKDVTVTLQFTATGSGAVTASYSLSIDSPYRADALGTPSNSGITSNCNIPAPPGTDGYQSLPLYRVTSFFGVQISNIGINENFTSEADDYIGNTWPNFVAINGITPDGTFYDNICAWAQIIPLSLPPATPLGSVKIDHASQSFFVGSLTSASGVQIQSDILQRYQDHGLHTSIVSPVR